MTSTVQSLSPPRPARKMRLINSGRDLAIYLREAFSELPPARMWDEIQHAAHLIRLATNERNHVVAEMEAYIEDLCEENRCEWCGFCQCVSTCNAPEPEPAEYDLSEIDSTERTDETGIFTPEQWDAFISEECARG